MKFLKPEAENFLKKALGDEGFEALQKFELTKESTQTVVDHEEVATALQIVPRTILSLLQKELGSMAEKTNKSMDLPVSPVAKMDVTKFANDVYSGEIYREGKVLARFKYRSLPGVGLVIMTTFELYGKDEVKQIDPSLDTTNISAIQKIIDERLNLQMTVRQIVDQKMSERDAIESIIKSRLVAMIKESSEKKEEPKKAVKLKDFLAKRSDKLNKNEYVVNMESLKKSECPDCGNKIFNGTGISACICYGDSGKVFLKKTEQGVKISFGKNWDEENIKMFLEVLRKKNRG